MFVGKVQAALSGELQPFMETVKPQRQPFM